MRRLFRIPVLAALALSLFGCNFDSGTPWRSGRYALKWIDTPDDVWLELQDSDGLSQVRVEPRVFAVGADQQWVVAKQHPGGDRTITNFFVVDAGRDTMRAQKSDVVHGPLTEAEFQELARQLHLPAFTKVLASLQ
jgi:hypothetical protein